MEPDDWASSNAMTDSETELQDSDDEAGIPYKFGSTPKLQFRKDVSIARWDEEMGMGEVIKKKGGMWTSTGVIRRGKLYCFIEEILFLAERGALILWDVNDTVLALKAIYEKVAEGKNGCSRESFEAYRHLKSLGYIVGRHNFPWILKSDKSCCSPSSHQVTTESTERSNRELEDNISIISLLKDMQINEINLTFDVYLPNSKFRKSSPGDPSFILCQSRDNPPSKAKVEYLERECKGIPLKVYYVEHGRVSFFSFDTVELPVLP